MNFKNLFYLTEYIRNITISTYINIEMVNETFYIPFFAVFKIQYIPDTCNTS